MTLDDFLKTYLYCNINEIEDANIKQIKLKYINKITKIVNDEYNIKDSHIEKEYNRLKDEEKKELEEYYKSNF